MCLYGNGFCDGGRRRAGVEQRVDGCVNVERIDRFPRRFPGCENEDDLTADGALERVERLTRRPEDLLLMQLRQLAADER